ncbi:hypothetical protein CR203_13435 [Salipaludibacillus neizhouensis]|uniref:Uncharacterized protein n=1 Tax=Salipaludibacillus neizhouensis TaxID=885475 RepID=A0A3A9K8W5_9BACI|nr:hypothetical protein [Salipaludibacillus neizhouensis]RKL66831.1 hypothetical protein CR203_13435 [Salipaludibacillus neizhouensis]
MSHKIQAYFKTENDAEAASAKLQKVNVSNVLIDKIPEGSKGVMLLPITNLGVGGSGMGTAAGPPGMLARLTNLKDVGKSDREKSDAFSHLLDFEVTDEDFEEALDVLSESDAYLDESVTGK